MSSTKPSPADFLPLHPFELRILLVLCEGKAHGYRIVKVIEERDAGWKRIFPANLYRRLRELLVAGLIVETEGPAEAEPFEAALVSADGRRVPTGKDFDPATGRPQSEHLLLLDAATAAELAKRLERADFRVSSVEEKPTHRRPTRLLPRGGLWPESPRLSAFDSPSQ